jgi:peptidoglycan hydrolase-like protein with peptidoglycan-binding domain
VTLAYRKPGLTLRNDPSADPVLTKLLQRDLRALGYLRRGIDGVFGPGTEKAVRALQYDLINNFGDSRGDDGRAPVAIADYNIVGGVRQVSTVSGVVDEASAACIEAMLADAKFPKLPFSTHPAADNATIADTIASMRNGVAPAPFLVAMLKQESGGQHFAVPQGANEDDFIVVGLDHQQNADADHVTSRGYGVGQYTLFHHPPRPDEVVDFISDPVRNVGKAFTELRGKFDRFVIGASGADDHAAEHPLRSLTLCKYKTNDPRYMSDCRNCALQAGKVDVSSGTPVFRGSQTVFRADQYYPTATYSGVPDRAAFACDWPYAMRRYNGGGLDSYHYQMRVLTNLLA